MKTLRAFGMGAVLALSLGLGAAWAQEHPEHPGEDAGMAAWQASMTPGPHHQMMASAAGDWDFVSKMWMDPSAPPMETTGSATMKVTMNGLFLTEDVKAQMMGMDWIGHGVFGYDNTKKKHIGIWYDSMGSMIMNFEGDCDGQCKVVTSYADFMDPMTSSMKRMKTVASHEGPDKHVMTMYDVVGANETKMMEITYTRKK